MFENNAIESAFIRHFNRKKITLKWHWIFVRIRELHQPMLILTSFDCYFSCFHLISHLPDHRWRWSNKFDICVNTRLSKVSSFRKKSITRVNGINSNCLKKRSNISYSYILRIQMYILSHFKATLQFNVSCT